MATPLLKKMAGASLVSIVAVSSYAPGAYADKAMEEVTVTAQKRDQSIQDVPIAIAAFAGDFIRNNGVKDVSDLIQYTPGLNMEHGAKGEPSIYIRGIGSDDPGVGSDASVGVYMNDIYIGRLSGAVVDFNDVERVEVLKGPQGTLFGRNSIGGAISIISKRPGDHFGGDVGVNVGNYQQRSVETNIDIPLSSNVFMRIGGNKNQREGYIKNAYDGKMLGAEDEHAERLALLFKPDDRFEALLRLSREDMDNDGPPARSANRNYLAGDPYDDYYSDLSTAAFERRTLLSSSAHLSWSLDDYAFKSISAYRKLNYTNRMDQTGTGSRNARLFTNIDVKSEEFSQELRLNFSNGKALNWFVGTSYYRERISQGSFIESTNETLRNVATQLYPSLAPVFVATLPNGVDYFETLDNGGLYQSYALYGDASYDLTPQWELTLGLRYTYDRKEHFVDDIGPVPAGTGISSITGSGVIYFGTGYSSNIDHWQAVTPRAVLNYHWSEDVSMYGSYTQGYKSGGFASFKPNQKFNNETVDSYEIGLKSMWWDNRVRLNGALFYYDYNDLQVQLVENAAVVVRNAGKAHGKGGELELTVLPTADWRLGLTAGYLKTDFKTFTATIGNPPQQTDLAGNELPFAPKVQTSVFAEYAQQLAQAGHLVYHLDYSFVGHRYFSAENKPLEADGSYGIFNARLDFKDKTAQWDAGLFCRNLTNTEYLNRVGGLAKDVIFAPKAQRGMPRTFGLDLSYKF